jgi:zinc protease
MLPGFRCRALRIRPIWCVVPALCLTTLSVAGQQQQPAPPASPSATPPATPPLQAPHVSSPTASAGSAPFPVAPGDAPGVAPGPAPGIAPSAAAKPAVGGPVAAMLSRVVHDTVLANGLQVIAIENHQSPLVTVEIVVHTGAFTQQNGEEGVPHLYEHMLFKAYSGPRDYSWGRVMGDLDAEYNGETGDEEVRYFVTLPSEKVEGGMRALAELVRDPDFKQDDLNEERPVVLDELGRDASEPIRGLFDRVGHRLWTTAWGRKDPGGDATALAAVTPKRLKEIFQQYYVPNNSAVIVSGDVTPARVFQLADERFSHWKRQPDPFANVHPYTVPPMARSEAVIVQGDAADVVMVIEWQGPSVGTDAAGSYGADMLSAILDQSGSTFQRHLIDSGLFASCSISYSTRAHVGPITLVAHMSIDSAQRAIAVLANEIHHLDSPDEFADEELFAARQGKRVQLALEMQQHSSVADDVAEFWGSAGLPYFMTYADQMGAVTRSDLQRFAQHYIVGAPMAIGLLVPRGAGEQLRPAVVAFIAAQ